MPRQRSTTTAPTGFARLEPEYQVTEALAPRLLDLLITPPDEREAIKNLRLLRRLLRLVPSTRSLFGLTPAKGRGRPRGSALAKDSTNQDRFVALAVHVGIGPTTVLRELCKVREPLDHQRMRLSRLGKKLGPLWADEYVHELTRMDPKKRLIFFKIAASMYDLPAWARKRL